MRRIRFLLPAIALVVAACNPPPSDAPPMEEPPAMDPVDMAMIPPYPAAPYGVNEGDTVFPISAKGYNLDRDHTDSSALPWEDVKIEALHFNPACKCMML